MSARPKDTFQKEDTKGCIECGNLGAIKQYASCRVAVAAAGLPLMPWLLPQVDKVATNWPELLPVLPELERKGGDVQQTSAALREVKDRDQ